ncbi:MAG: arylamine N-acetyltransferase [Dehalococcoidia bacterium]
METPPLSPPSTRLALGHLDVTPAATDRDTLAGLLDAYVRHVPWESASRIAKRAANKDTRDCPRWPDEFWSDAARFGTGGTCFESNYAFFSLLRALGYHGYLTINDMNATRGCHTAIIIRLDGERLLVDAGFPVHSLIALDEHEATQSASAYQTYTLQPEGDRRFTLTRGPHPAPYCFTLIDQPIADQDYRAATTADYGDAGLFLDQVIVTRVVDGRIWRFADREQPSRLAEFTGGSRTDHPIEGDIAATVGTRFGMDEAVLQRALAAIPDPSPGPAPRVSGGRGRGRGRSNPPPPPRPPPLRPLPRRLPDS